MPDIPLASLLPPAQVPLSSLDPFDIAAMRTRQSVQPEGGRIPGRTTKLATNILPVLGNAAVGLVQGVNDTARDAMQQSANRMAGADTIDMGPATNLAMMATGARIPFAGAGELGAGGGGIKAYHGSPHDFERFDMSKIGTGEGAQAYGHGLYFADREGTAKAYREKLASGSLTTPDGLLSHGDAWHSIRDAAQGVGGIHPDQSGAIARNVIDDVQKRGIEKVLKPYRDINEAARDYAGAAGTQFVPAYEAAFAKARELAIAGQNKGRMYEVNINAHPDQFLDWDKPLAQMSDPVKKALNDAWLAHPIDHANMAGNQI